MAGPSAAVEIPDLKEFVAGLRTLEEPKTWTKAFSRTQRELGKEAAGWARADASGMGGPFRHFAGAIRGAGGISGAKLTVAPRANATFWGAKKRTGWNAGNDGRPQHPEWVGAGWDVAAPGQGPYAINSALAAHIADIESMYGDAVDNLLEAAARGTSF